jgi:hypothetical protein
LVAQPSSQKEAPVEKEQPLVKLEQPEEATMGALPELPVA